MKTNKIKIKTSTKNYSIIIGRDLISKINKILEANSLRFDKCLIVTDKMPQNFRFLPLICAALPEAKIIHVQRNAAATCWSNYKQYFVSDRLGYCYDLKDLITFYGLFDVP
mgnify:CR=1 FL=1